MTATQLLFLVIAGLALLLAADLLRLSWANRRKQRQNVDPGFRRVGTFGSLKNFDSSGASFQDHGQGHNYWPIIAGLLLAVLVVGGIVLKISWDEAHPDIRTRFGRDFEFCVAEEGISRWDTDQVEYCIRRLHAR